MIKICRVCDGIIHDGDDIVAVVVSKFVQIPSKKSYAIGKPIDCWSIQHKKCYMGDTYGSSTDTVG